MKTIDSKKIPENFADVNKLLLELIGEFVSKAKGNTGREVEYSDAAIRLSEELRSIENYIIITSAKN